MTEDGETRNRRRVTDDDYLTRREANVIIRSGEAAQEAAKEAHDAQHDAENLAVTTAMTVAERERQTHAAAHEREHKLHAEKHLSEDEAIKTALDAVSRERLIHAEAHDREHAAHQREHALANIAIEKAERATDLRFAATNAFREQLNDIVMTLASKESMETLQKESDRRFEALTVQLQQQFAAAEKLTQDRYESNRAAIVELQKGDVKAEGRGIGSAAMVAYIVTAIGIVGSVLAIIVILSNFATGQI